MAEYIEYREVQTLAKKIVDMIHSGKHYPVVYGRVILDMIDELQTADVAPVRRGKWETVMLDHERMGCRPTAHYCSECHQITWFRTFFCPNCGAKMDGET